MVNKNWFKKRLKFLLWWCSWCGRHNSVPICCWYSFVFLLFEKIPSRKVLANFVVRLEFNQNRGFYKRGGLTLFGFLVGEWVKRGRGWGVGGGGGVGLNTIWLEIRDSRFRIQDLKFKIQKEKYEMKMHFNKKVPNSILSNIKFYSTSNHPS